MGERELQRQLKKWQVILGLESWDISAKLVSPWELDNDCDAKCELDQYHEKGRISITHPKFHNPDSPSYETVQFLLLHELLHVRLFPDGVQEGTPANVALEKGINRLTRVLLGTG